MAPPAPRKHQPNVALRDLRQGHPSPTRPNECLSRPELADMVNRELASMNIEHQGIDGNYVGKLEQGKIRSPREETRREAFRRALQVSGDEDLGFFSYRSYRSNFVDRTLSAAGSGHLPASTATPQISSTALRAPTPPSISTPRRLPAHARQTGLRIPEAPTDLITMSVHIDGREVTMSLSRRDLLRLDAGTALESFALGQQSDMLREAGERTDLIERVTVTSAAHLDEILQHLREQWHAQVKTDNLLGPRFALTSVLSQITVVDALRNALRNEQRLAVVRLGAQYAESAAWLYEDSGHLPQARFWTNRALEWAYEADDKRMLAWTTFRRSQQAGAIGNVAEVVGLARAARRDEERLATPMRAAIRVQEAYGHALDGDEGASQQLLDEAHTWAATDTVGDARDGHGSYCTSAYIEIQRARCWLATGKASKAISLYEEGLRTLPPVYQRNRAAAQSWLAMAYLADGQVDRAASTAHAALQVARGAGSMRIVQEIESLGADLTSHRRLQSVAALLDDLNQQGA
jgi:tetratricopeptide (TPR) repeat protein